MAIPDGPSRTPLSSALEILRLEQKLWVRLAATRKQFNGGEGNWQEMMFDIVSGEAPPGWEELCWRYSSVLFIAIEQTGEAVAQWLEDGQVHLNGEDIELPVIQGEVEWQLHDSKSSWSSYAPLPWPTRTVSFGNQAAGSESGVGMLLDDAAPPFASYYFGAAFVFGIAQPIGGRATAAPMWRDQRKFGRIKHVRLVPHEGVVVVDVEGEDIDGATVDLTGSMPGSSVSLKANEPQTVELEMYEELTQGSLVILRKGQRSLDRRSVTRQYGRGDEPDVELVEEEGNRLQAYIFNRENYTADFKQEVPHTKDKHSIFQCMKSVAAFANGEGGVLLFGVNNDEQIVGIPRDGLDGTKGQLTRWVSSWVEPIPHVTYEEFEIEDHPESLVLGMHITWGPEVPYQVGEPGKGDKKVYVRHYSDSVPARQYEIKQMVLARNQQQLDPYGLPGKYFK